MRHITVTALTVLCCLAQTATAQIKMTGLAGTVSGSRPAVRVAAAQGNVEVYKQQTGQWVKAYDGMTLGQGDRIRTGGGAAAEIDMNEVDALMLDAKTSVELEAVVTDDPRKEPVVVKHTGGKILYCAAPLIGRPPVKLTTGTSVVTIKGTICGQEEQPDGSMKVAVVKGNVFVENPAFNGRGQNVKKGEFTQVRQNQVPLIPRDMSSADYAQLNSWAGSRRSGVSQEPQAGAGDVPAAENAQADETPAADNNNASEKAPPFAKAADADAPDDGTDTGDEADGSDETVDDDAADASGKTAGGQDAAGDGFSMSGAAGSYTNDAGQQITYISLRPEIPIWKFGVALDVELGFIVGEDGEMVFNEDDWDEPGDYLEKIYYIRYGQKGETFYAKVGALSSATLGYGLVMNGYSNTIEYPDNKRIGVETEVNASKFGLQGVLGSVRELGNSRGGGVLGVRASYKPVPFLEFGVTYAGDLNQYANLRDADDDGVPDYVDKFPDDAAYARDTDDDGLPDGFDIDRDNNNKIELDSLDATQTAILESLRIGYEHTDSAAQDPEPFNLDNVNDNERTFHEVAFDVAVPVVNTKLLNIVVYAQAAQIIDAGRGFTIPGVQAGIGPLKLVAEYRIFEDRFWGSYFDQMYELNRVTVAAANDSAVPVTKEQLLQGAEAVKGVYAAADLDVFGFVTLGATYEDLRSESSYTDRTLYGEASLNPALVPKLSEATVYYKLAHVDDLSTWKQPGALFGYRLGYELSPSSSLVFSYQEAYYDLDGNGKVADDEIDRRTGIETVFSF